MTVDPIRELRIRARLLHKDASTGDEAAARRVRAPSDARDVQLKHCLEAVAREHGFTGWAHALRVLGGDPEERDFGTLLYPREGAPYPNLWVADEDEARRLRMETGGYLLAYRLQFVVAQRELVAALGLDPDDADWRAIDFDWPRPRERAARTRLYGRLIAARR